MKRDAPRGRTQLDDGFPPPGEPRHPIVRRAEVRRFGSVLRSLRQDGRSKIIELSGEPGSGKTRLLAELKREAEALGLTALCGCCAESEQHLPYRSFTAITGSSLMVRALRDLTVSNPDLLSLALTGKVTAPGAPAPRSSAEQRSAVQLAARYLLTNCSRDGLVLLFDDFHWADAPSAELVEYFVRYPVDVPLLMIIAQRPRQASDRLRGVLAHGVEMGTVERMRLTPLSVEQSAEVLGLPSGDPCLPQLHRQSGGNPMYLRALARITAADGRCGPKNRPPTRRDVSLSGEPPFSSHTSAILTETASLPPEDSAVISAVAVLGDGFDHAALAEVAGVSHDEALPAIERLTAKDLIKPMHRDTSLALRHPALRPLIYSHLFHPWRVRAHRRAIGVLTRRGAPPADVAHHILASPDTSGTGDIRVLEHAARNALWSEPDRSVLWLRTALRMSRESGRPDAHLDLTLSLSLARALISSGQLADGRRLLQRCSPGIRELPARLRIPAVALHALVECLLDQGDQARALLAEELARTGTEPPVEAVRLYVVQCLTEVMSGRPPSPEQMEPAVRIAVAHDDRMAEAGALALRGLCQALGSKVEDAEPTLTASAALIDGFPERSLKKCPEYLAILGRAELLIGRFDAAKRHFERGVALMRASRHVHYLPLMLVCLGLVCLRIGPLDEVLRAATEAQELARRIGADQLYRAALAIRSIGIGLTGSEDIQVAVRTAKEALVASPPDSRRWGADTSVVFAGAARLGSPPHRCVTTIVGSCGGPGLHTVPPALRPACFEILADAAVAAGEPAAEWSASAMATAAKVPGAFSTPYAAAAQAHLLRGRGDHQRAARRYLDAAGLFEKAGLVGDETRVLTLGAACSAAAGQHHQATQMLIKAEELARTFGAARPCESLGTADRTPRDGGKDGDGHPDSAETLSTLTNREREVAGLASTGTRTRDIAKELGLSPKTVDVHLSRIYRKLNVRSRTELAWLVAELGGLRTRLD
nr:AAA family ATPase [Streptomyces sp. NBC_00857]